MNPRICELAKQAGLQSFYVEYSPWQVEFEKFAELVVQDCVTQCAMMGVSNWDNDDISWAVEGCIDNIRSHFGESDENL